MRIWTFNLACLSVTALLLTACGESADHRLQRAQIAIAANKPDSALELAQSVLQERPKDMEAMLIVAQSYIRLGRFDAARNTLDQLLQNFPDQAKARRLMIAWAFNYLDNLMKQSDFVSSADRQTQFDQAMATGQAQAEWIKNHDNGTVDCDMFSARFAIADSYRFRKILDVKSKSLSNAGLPGDDQDDENLVVQKKLQEQIKGRTNDAINRLKSVIDANPRHFEAADMYIGLIAQEKLWSDLWIMTQTLAKEKDIPAALSNKLVVQLFYLPESIQPSIKTLELCRKLQDNVDPARRNNSDWKVTEARLLLRTNQPAKAQPILEEVSKDEPRNFTARFLLGQAFYYQKMYPKAKAILEKLVTEINAPEVFTYYGLTLKELGEIAGAKEALKKAVDLNPDDAMARSNFLQILAKEGKIDAARADVDSYYNKNPSDPRAIRFKIQYEIARNQRDAVEDIIAKVENLRPLLDEHILILADGYTFLGKYDSALLNAQELVRRRPDAIESHLRLAQAMLMLNQDEQVKQLLNELKTKFPNSPDVDQMLGELYLQRQAFDKAVEYLQKVVDSQPENDNARLSLIRCLANLSLTDEAIEHLNLMLEKNPRNATAHAMAARIYQFMNKSDKANEHLSQIDPNNIDERTSPALLAQLKIRANQVDEAQDICNRALAMGNNDPVLRQLLAGIYLQKKDPAQAEVHLLGLARAQPNNLQVYDLLRRFYIEQKMIDKGLTELVNLQTGNEVLSRLTQGAILNAVNRTEEALQRISPMFEPLVRQRNKSVLPIADALARTYLLRKELNEALKVYQALINADFMTSEATLRQIDLTAALDKPDVTIAKLDALVNKLGPDDKRPKFEIIRRFARMGQHDKAMAIVDNWLSQQPRDIAILRTKATLLQQMNKPGDAAQTLRDAIALAPEDVSIHRQLSSLYLNTFDFPSTEAALNGMAKIDAGARINANADLGLMFTALGLNSQAREVFDRLEKESRVNDPRVMMAMGRAFAALDQNEQARERLAMIPDYAQQYTTAQILIARLEQAKGLTDAAEQRLNKLTSDPRTVGVATQELLSLNLHNKQTEELLRWSDKKLAEEALPEQTRRAWINIRILIADMRRDLQGMLDGLEKMSKLYPESLQLVAARVAVMSKAGKTEQARQLYLVTPKLATTRWGPLLAVHLGEPPANVPDLPHLSAFIVALASGDLVRAKTAVEQLGSLKTIFPKDLMMIVDRSDAASKDVTTATRSLATALIANDCNLPRLGADISIEVIKRMPSMVPAHAVLVQSLLDLEEPTEQALNQIRQSLSNTGIAMLLTAYERSKAKDFAAAADSLGKLIEREPSNIYVRYSYAQTLQLAGKPRQAIEQLDKLYAEPGPYHIMVSNDLAYLIAEHAPDRMDEAYKIAERAYELSKKSPPLLDTLGWFEYKRGNPKQALVYLSQAISPLQSIPEVHYHIGVVYKELGNKTWSRYHLETAAGDKSDKPEIALAKKALDELGPP